MVSLLKTVEDTGHHSHLHIGRFIKWHLPIEVGPDEGADLCPFGLEVVPDADVGEKGQKGSTQSISLDNTSVFFHSKLAVAIDFPIKIADSQALL